MAIGALISCCNVKAPLGRYSLVYFRFADSTAYFVDWWRPETCNHPPAGITGLAQGWDLYFAGLQSVPDCKLAVFGPDLRPKTVVPLPGVRDIHGLRVVNGHLLAVSTGTSKILIIDPLGKDRPRTFWEAPETPTQRHLHLNDYIEFEGRRLVLTHKPCVPNQGHNGTIFDIDRGAVVSDGMAQPHSLMASERKLFVCDSQNWRVIEIEDGVKKTVLKHENRFWRGMAVAGDRIVVAASAMRVFSRSEGTAKRYANEMTVADERYMSWLYFLDRRNYAIEAVFPFSPISFEIYDVLPIEREPSGDVLIEHPGTVRAQANANRIAELEQRIAQLTERAAAAVTSPQNRAEGA
jgi:hypothetical protein